MYLQRLILLLVGGTLLGLTVSSVNAKAGPGPVKRFSINKKVPPSPKFETKAQKYAHELTTRKPTRRSTAMRRQTSAIPTVSATIGATDAFFGTNLGSLVYRTETLDWTVSMDGTPATLIVPQAGFSATSTSRVQTDGGNTLAWSSCATMSAEEASTLTLGTGSLTALCLRNVAEPAGPGSPPRTIVVSEIGGVWVYETDIWGDIPGVVMWTNHDLSRTDITIVVLTSSYHYPDGPQLLGLPDVGAYLSHLTSLQISAGYPLVDYPLGYTFVNLQIV